MNKSIKIGLLISVCVLVILNAGLYFYSSQLHMDGVSETDAQQETSEKEGGGKEGADKESSEVEKSAKSSEKSHQNGEHAHKLSEKESDKGGKTKEVALGDEKDIKHGHHGEQGDHSEGEGEKEEEVGVIKSKYQPKLIGQCKNLYAKYVKKGDFTGNHRAFTYSFDGNSGNCAIVEEQKSKEVAEKEALKACEKSKSDSKNYAPCFVMASF